MTRADTSSHLPASITVWGKVFFAVVWPHHLQLPAFPEHSSFISLPKDEEKQVDMRKITFNVLAHRLQGRCSQGPRGRKESRQHFSPTGLECKRKRDQSIMLTLLTSGFFFLS
jgi:hypothetical protein